ncbi:MAG TPA: DM13 domain-containing protein, partial [Saprospiraceae bacterium]|nr:DM13 domain-containing protein [Saprospiraceae bacterium]
MRKIGFWLILLTFLFQLGCSKDLENVDQGEIKVDKILYEGKFISSSRYSTSGDIRVIVSGGKEKLQFINFKTDGGPDLRIYVSNDTRASDFVEISKDVKNGN